MSAKPNETSAAYPVGYCRPPIQHRFRKGQSGNPRGRQRRDTRTLPPPSMREAFLKAANQPLTMTMDGRQVTMTRLEGAVHRLSSDALKGNVPAMELFLQYGHMHSEQAEEIEAAHLTHEQALQELMNPPWLEEDEDETRSGS